jgi:NAD(P)-dependent dehydrogenase (short-subunit alcohol dehydrogenase family)
MDGLARYEDLCSAAVDLGLQGRVVLVTGSNRGIGRAIARSAAAEGAIVALCGRDESLGAEAVAELGADRAAWFTADVTDPERVAALPGDVVARLGRLDAVVNNAGRFGGGAAIDLQAKGIHEGIDTKVAGAVALVRAALPALRRSDQARVVNIGGISAQRVTPGAAVTAIANAGLATLSGYLAQELAPDGVTVNCVIPGYVLTDVWRERARALSDAEGLGEDEGLQAVLDRHGLQGRWGDPAEIADVVVFLLSAQARFVSGAAFRVDGAQFEGLQR